MNKSKKKLKVNGRLGAGNKPKAHRLDRIVDKVYNQVWCILPANHHAIQKMLEAHLAGVDLTDYQPFQDGEDDSDDYQLIGNTAILPVEGTILNKASGLEAMCGAFSLETFKANLNDLANNAAVENVILSFDSGGGTVGGLIEASQAIADLAKVKDVYSYVGAGCICASAAYWLASQAGAIFTSPSAEVGGIGVYITSLDVTRAMENEGIKLELFKAGDNKAMGLPGTSLTDEQRGILQGQVNKTYNVFKGYVSANRPNIPDTAMQGLTYNGADSVSNGFTDGIIDSLDALVNHLNDAAAA